MHISEKNSLLWQIEVTHPLARNYLQPLYLSVTLYACAQRAYVTCRQGKLTLPDTLSRPIKDLNMIYFLRPDFPLPTFPLALTLPYHRVPRRCHQTLWQRGRRLTLGCIPRVADLEPFLFQNQCLECPRTLYDPEIYITFCKIISRISIIGCIQTWFLYKPETFSQTDPSL